MTTGRVDRSKRTTRRQVRKTAKPVRKPKRAGPASRPDETDGLGRDVRAGASEGAGALYVAYSRRRLEKEYLPRILRCLEELTEEDIWWRPHESSNSVGNLILHLSGNVGQWINSGLGGVSGTRDRDAEFSERGPLPKKELVKKITAVMRTADETLARFDSSKLMEVRRIQRYDTTCLDAISHVVEHFAQHLGQIVYITKLRKGIDLKFYNL